MNRTIALAAACFAMLATPSLAFDWSGPYIGLGAEYGNGTSYISGSAADISSDPISGPSALARIGYNFPRSQLMLGVEGDVSIGGTGLSITDTVQSMGTHTGPPPIGEPIQNQVAPGASVTTRTTFAYGIDADADLIGRAGVPFDRFMPYVLGGISVSRMSAKELSVSGLSTYLNMSASSVGFGYLLGVGVEIKITPAISTFLEAKYRDYGSHDLSGIVGGTGATWVHSPQVASITSGLDFHF